MKKIITLILILLGAINILVAQRTRTLTATTTGDWANSLTWGGNTPATGDSMVIPTGITVTISGFTAGNSYTLGLGNIAIRVLGTLSINNNANAQAETVNLSTGSTITISTGGLLKFVKNSTASGSPSGNGDVLKINTANTLEATKLYNVSATAGAYQGPVAATRSSGGNFVSSSEAGIPLPVKFSNIKASEKGTGVQIDWTSYSELNLANYQIERSADGIYFTSIGEVTPRNVSDATNYNFFDAMPLSGTSFYRIRNNDIDGKSGLSNIVKFNLNKNIKTIGIYPNPVIGNRVSFQTSDLAKGTYNVEVINAIGTRVFQQAVNHAGGAINQSLNLPTLQSGQYTLRINGTTSTSTHKITILQ